MYTVFSSIVTDALLPILAIVGFGFGLQRWRPMESQTLVTLNLYFFVPIYLFVRVQESSLSWFDIAHLGLASLLPVLVLGLLIYKPLQQFQLSSDTMSALMVGGLFANYGNFGLPVAELAFGTAGAEVHSILVLFANFSVFSLAYSVLAIGRGQGLGSVLNYFRLPYLYCVLAALIVRDAQLALPSWIRTASHTIAAGLVPIALVTLGAQLAQRARWPRWPVLLPTLVVKFVLLPFLAFGTVWCMGLWPWPGVVLVLGAAAPTAINPLLLSMQLKGDCDTLSDCVFWTTLLSAFAVAIWMTALKMLHPDAFVVAP